MDDEHSEFLVDVNVSPQFFGWIFSLGKDVRLQYRKQALQIEKYATEKEIQIEFDDTDLYILTNIAAWKIAYGYHFDWYKLLHCPFAGRSLTMEEAKTAHYHVQADVPRNQSPYKYLQYIVKHDAAKKIEQIDYKNLPQKTKKQKKKRIKEKRCGRCCLNCRYYRECVRDGKF